mmetsp:Transcript_25882/g.49297  ORF Transcript_25882/g.49297 Transcript_25882/m.49297 type:complete len:449 (-) Transcript_25882:123-1469(-)
MYRSRSLLTKVGKSITAEASKATSSEAAVAAAVNATPDHGGKIPQEEVPPSAPTYPYETLYHHKHPELLQPTTPQSFAYVMHHLTSAVNAVYSLGKSQEYRDRFLDLTGGGGAAPIGDSNGKNNDSDEGYSGSIINSNILGQSDMGFVKVLTLYQDLNNPLYEETYQENPKFLQEFMDGCGFALGEFHNSKDNIMPKFINGVEDKSVGLSDLDKNTTTESEDDNNNNNQAEISLKSNYSIFRIARDDPNSVESTFLSMTTPEMMETIQSDGITRLLLAKIAGENGKSSMMPPVAMVRNSKEANDLSEYYESSTGKVRLVKEDTKVMNVALLGARVEEIYPPAVPNDRLGKKGDDEEEEDPEAPLEDDSLMAYRNADKEDTAQIVTQLEVLYELQQSTINDEGKVHTQTSVMVGKFETCLQRDPNGDDGLQWRLCSYRPAVEFGYFNTW